MTALHSRKLVFILFTSNELSICGEAENGAEGIEKARETRPDIIVMDYSMSVMDGINCFRDLAVRFFIWWGLHTVSDSMDPDKRSGLNGSAQHLLDSSTCRSSQGRKSVARVDSKKHYFV
jgi:DNA-binding NarL/FixJ family response regulator